jgi:hypothetical protein
MASAAPLFYITVQQYLDLVLLIAFLAVEAVAFLNCLTQRSDAFPVVGSLSKIAWVAILAACLIFTAVCARPGGGLSIFGFAAITATLVYLLDVRPALRDAVNGTGSW